MKKLNISLAILSVISLKGLDAKERKKNLDYKKYLPKVMRGEKLEVKTITFGLSGASVLSIKDKNESYILKISPSNTSQSQWQMSFSALNSASSLGIAPRVVFSSAKFKSILSKQIVDISIGTSYRKSNLKQVVLNSLSKKLRSLHNSNPPKELKKTDPLVYMENIWKKIGNGKSLPEFAHDAYKAVLRMTKPEYQKVAFTHNDLNSRNILFDGKEVWLVDWDEAGLNHPFYDLATISNFLLMNKDEAKEFLELYLEEKANPKLTYAAEYYRKVSTVLIGLLLLQAGEVATMTDRSKLSLENSLSTIECYQLIEMGKMDITKQESQEVFGLSFIKGFFSM